jgi:DNA recombination protein RmuC
VPPLVYLIVGLALGGLIGWLIRATRPAPPADGKIEAELRQQMEKREAEIAQLRSALSQNETARVTAEAGVKSAEQSLREQREIQERAMRESREAQAQALAELKTTFQALSAEALKQSAPEFLRLAEQNFGKLQEAAKGDLAGRQEAIKALVEPLKLQLESYQSRLQQAQTTQSAALGEVKKQLETLGLQSQALAQETQQFRTVLKSNSARGRWGEETLRRVVEAAGMSAHCDFTEQTQAGEGKPDLVVRLPGDRVIIVDAKVPDLDFLSALEIAEPAKRAASLVDHATRLKGTIKALADRDYPRLFPNALDHVVLFLPAESLFSAALEGDRDLIIWAAGKKILLATPASLIALLRSVSVSWQQHSQTENSQKIAEAAQLLYERVIKFLEHFENIRAGLERASNAYNEALASYNSRVRPASDALAKLGAGVEGKSATEIPPLSSTLRLPPAS